MGYVPFGLKKKMVAPNVILHLWVSKWGEEQNNNAFYHQKPPIY